MSNHKEHIAVDTIQSRCKIVRDMVQGGKNVYICDMGHIHARPGEAVYYENQEQLGRLESFEWKGLETLPNDLTSGLAETHAVQLGEHRRD